MPEIKPVLNKISAFDAKNGTTISFSWSGAQSHKNRLVIKEYDRPYRTVYDCTIKTMALKHTLHIDEEDASVSQKIPYGLFNGKRYLASVYVYDVYGNESLKSNDVEFYCFSTPIFEFTNFTNIDQSNTAKVNTNSIYLNVKYKQTDGEVINEYKFILFDSFGNELIASKTFYGSNNDDNLQWTLGGITDTEKKTNGELDYNKSYNIVCRAETIHGMSLSIEQKFVVQKDMGGVGALIDLHTLPDHTVSISSNFKIVNAVIDGEEKYLYDKTENPFALNLTNGDNLSYFDGFNMTSPWSITAIIGDCIPNSTLMTYTNNNGDYFKVSYIVKKYSLVEKAYFLFETSAGNIYYILRSEYLPITDKWYIIHLKYNDGYYTFKVYDPEELNYILPDNAIEDKILNNPKNIFVQKNTVLSSQVTEGENLFDFSMPVNFGEKYNFVNGEHYEITFSIDNIIKNNYNDFTLLKYEDIIVNSDNVYVAKDGKRYIVHFTCSNEIQSPSLCISWSNKCITTENIKNYYKSETYCVIQNVEVKNILEDYDLDNVYLKYVTPTSIGTLNIQSSIDLNLYEKGFEFIKGYKYLIKFSFKNIIENNIGVILSETNSCSVNINNTTYTGTSFELEYTHESDSTSPNINITWNNECICSLLGKTAISFAVLENIDVIDVEHPDILEDKSYQYIFKNTVDTKLGKNENKFNAEFRIDTKYLTDNSREKDKCLNDGDEYILRFNPKYLYDPYYGVFINDDITFTAKFLDQIVTFKSGDAVEIPFIYKPQNEELKVYVNWTQLSTNYIESKYSRADTYLLIDNITYGYKDLLDDNIYDYDYAVKLELNNINPQTGNVYTVDTNKEFIQKSDFKLKDLFVFDKNDSVENEFGLISTCNIKMKYLRKLYHNNSYLINVITEPNIFLLNDEQLEFSYDKTTQEDKIEITKLYIIDDNIGCNLSWTETAEISKDLSGGGSKQKINVYIVAWISKSNYIETTN